MLFRSAVVAAIRVLEDSPLFNAGHGAVMNAEGRCELDASIMDGRTQAAGAIAGVTRVRNPITLARAVMERSPHVMFAGAGAERFAEQLGGIELVPNEYFQTDRRREELRRAPRGAALFPRELVPLDEIERQYIMHVLQRLNGNMTRAAEILEIDRRTLYRMVERFGARSSGATA